MRVAIAGLIAAQSMIFGLAVNLSPPAGSARPVLHAALALSAVIVYLLVGLPLTRTAVRAALRGQIVFEQLFLAGILGAFGASVHSSLTGEGHVYYEVVAILLAIYTFGTILADRRRKAVIDAADALGREFQTCERIDDSGRITEVPTAAIQIGDLVLVPGDGGIPIDGIVEEGVAFVRETSLTGEPFPVVKRAGDLVYAGSRCVDQALKIRATSPGNARRLDDLLGRVRTAQENPSRLEREADRLVTWFLPVVMLVATVTFAGWTWHAGWVTGLFNALAVILVACPCSMGLATPIGIWSALADLARRGIIANSSDLVERLASVDCVVFDKTGTLGEEDLEIADFICRPGLDRTRLQAEIAAVEAASGHPIARAFRSAGAPFLARDVRLVPGAGLQGRVDSDGGGALIAIGNANLLAPGQQAEANEWLGRLLVRDGATHEVFVLRDGMLAGVASLRERLRASAHDVIGELESAGLACRILTGDRAESAAAHHLPNLEAGLSPLDKAQRVAALAHGQGKHRVLFVGDGVNDAPAMAEALASLSISGGSLLAREASQGEILGGDLRAIPFAIARCREAIQSMRRNLRFAAGYNLIGIALAASGILHPVVAALLMLASSFSVTWRALRHAHSSAPVRLARIDSPKPTRRPAAAEISTAVVCLALAAQGPIIAHLGGFRGIDAIGFYALFLAAALVCFLWLHRRPIERQAGMALGMLSIGGVAMLGGWWADAGFGAVVRDGVCLCGCATSAMGLAIFGKLNWMSASMVAASLPAIAIERLEYTRWLPRLGCWAAGLAGMLAGMELALFVMAQIPTTNPQVHFFATYAAMALGMITGMLCACGVWRKFLHP